MEDFEKISQFKEGKEIEEFFKAYSALEKQIKNPTRDGMIKAFTETQKIAYNEIAALEKRQGNVRPKPWSNFSNKDLLCKLPTYKQGLYNHAVNKFGEEIFKKLLKEHERVNQNQ